MRRSGTCWLAGGLMALLVFTGGEPLSAQEPFDSDAFSVLRWQNLGPLRGGRSTAVAGSLSRPMEYYFGATGGGLWKTTDGGQNWRNVTDHKITTASIGAVAICEADPDVVYIGGGETEIRGNIQQGDGLYKSTNGGSTWTHIGLRETQNTSRIRIHPEDCDRVFVAAFGKHSAANPERGVYRTTDGGESWEQVLNRPGNEWTGAVDLSFAPSNPDVIYAALWEAWRKSWGMSSGGEGSGLFRSTDGGDNWEELTGNKPGLPEGMLGKIGVAVSPANPDIVWTIIENENGGVFRSDDGGENWVQTNDERKLRQRAFYYTRIYADPVDESTMYVLNTAFFKSTDGGETFPTPIRVPHGDNHDLWIAGDDSQRMINGNDGGGNVSFNGGTSWTDQDYRTAQFYRVTTTNHEPYHICGAQQDNSTACVPSGGWNFLSGQQSHFYTVGGCESGYIAPHPENLDVFFAGCYGGSLSRLDRSTGARRAVNVWPENPMGQSSEDLVERVQWTFPIVFSNHDAGVLYTGTQKVWKSLDEGGSWEQLSPDLTRADASTIGASGGPITKDQTGVETYATVFTIAPSFHDPDVIWAGSDDGLVHVTRDGGANWANVTPDDAPDFVRINTIEASPVTPGKAYVAGIRYLVDDDRSPYVWKTEDYGASWTKIVNGFPEDDFIRAVREDPARPGLLYAASERTVYASWDDGANWQPLTLNLPTVQVSDLVVEDHDLVIGTHGRAFWVLRDIDMLREFTPEIEAADAHLFAPRATTRGVDQGAQIFYRLGEEAENVVIEFIDADGSVIQSYEASGDSEEPEEGATPQRGGGGFGGFGGGTPRVSRRPGTHKITWNLAYPAWTDFEGRIFWAARPQGPTAVPGMYSVRLTVDGESQETPFEIRLDPRLEGTVTQAELQERFDLAISIRDRVTEANEAVLRIRNMKGQIDDRTEAADNQELNQLAATVTSRLGDVEGEVYQVKNESNQDPLNFPIKLNNKLAALVGTVEGGESAPTAQSFAVFEHLSGLLDAELQELEIVIQQDVARLNELLRQLGMDPIQTENLITD